MQHKTRIVILRNCRFDVPKNPVRLFSRESGIDASRFFGLEEVMGHKTPSDALWHRKCFTMMRLRGSVRSLAGNRRETRCFAVRSNRPGQTAIASVPAATLNEQNHAYTGFAALGCSRLRAPNEKIKRLPWPTVLSALMLPPCSSTRRRVMDNPRPAPSLATPERPLAW